jgi:hypothetical protein
MKELAHFGLGDRLREMHARLTVNKPEIIRNTWRRVKRAADAKGDRGSVDRFALVGLRGCMLALIEAGIDVKHARQKRHHANARDHGV